MSLLSRLTKIEARIPGGRGRKIREIIESIVTPNPIIGGPPVVEEVIRKNLDTGAVEMWDMTSGIPDPLPAELDAAAVERAKSPSFEGRFSGPG
jgi:hypothetical protein